MDLGDLYPFESRWTDLGGVQMHYLDEGSGPPVVMVHGNPTWSFYFRQLVVGLRDTHRCIVPDHVGCGRSDKPSPERYPYTLAQRVDDLDRLLREREVGHGITLVVHDWGGMIGLCWAVRNPGRIARIVVLNTAAFPKPSGKRLPWQLALCRAPLLGSVLVRGMNGFVKYAADHCSAEGPLKGKVREAYVSPYGSWADRIAVHRFVEDIPLDDSHPSWRLMDETATGLGILRDKPMLVCWGMKDFVFDHHFLAEWEYRFPDATVHRFPDAGHYVLEDAATEILPLVRGFAG